MSDTTKGMMNFVPGMDFVQNLFKAAPGIAQQLPPSLTQWIAPTTSIEDIDKKIADLKAVQGWLETNTSLLKATVQALEVQRMTISTLKSMKLSLADVPGYAAGAAKQAAKEAVNDIKEKPLDPMQWWGALSKQMTQPFAALDAKAMQQAARQVTKVAAKKAASAAASGAAGAAVDAAFGMMSKGMEASLKTSQGMLKNVKGLSAAAVTAGAKKPAKRGASSTANKAVGKRKTAAKR
jgi:hypothetical protein